MTRRERAVSRASRWVAVGITVAVVCSATGVALASTGAEVSSTDGRLGPMLTGRNGHSLYLFHQDWGGKSYCYGTCATTWMPDITNGRPTTPSGSSLDSKLLGTIRRRNGQLQVTFNGHPLYFYSGDTQAGTIRGESKDLFGGRWFVVGTNGKALKPFNPGHY